MKKISKTFIKKILPKRASSDSKIESGKVLIVAGGKGFYGAGLLSALAATRSGAGYTHLMSDLVQFPWLKFPDFIVHSFSLNELKKHSDHVVAIGPGLGTSKIKKRLLSYLIKNKIPKVILDADALSLLAQMKISSLPESWILTPHEEELGRLLKLNPSDIKKNGQKSVLLAQKKYGCIVLLKGADTLIATPGNLFLVNSGTRALAKAGSADVLLGMIAAFYAQKQKADEAAILGCFIHGYASELWLEKGRDYLSMRPTDLIDQLPETLHLLRK